MNDNTELPPDPDYADVPPPMLALDGEPVTATLHDGTVEVSHLLIVPELFAHVRRLREGFYNNNQEDE